MMADDVDLDPVLERIHEVLWPLVTMFDEQRLMYGMPWDPVFMSWNVEAEANRARDIRTVVFMETDSEVSREHRLVITERYLSVGGPEEALSVMVVTTPVVVGTDVVEQPALRVRFAKRDVVGYLVADIPYEPEHRLATDDGVKLIWLTDYDLSDIHTRVVKATVIDHTANAPPPVLMEMLQLATGEL